jgi:uncharacterized membrane protein YhaH (DUF805 family)
MTLVQLLTSYDGRIGRSGFWLGMLCLVVIVAALSLLGTLLGLPFNLIDGDPEDYGALGIGFALIELLVIGYTQFAVYAKRWHDHGKSGWWTLILFVPVLGFFWWLIECGTKEGDPGPNAYGPPPGPVKLQLT